MWAPKSNIVSSHFRSGSRLDPQDIHPDLIFKGKDTLPERLDKPMCYSFRRRDPYLLDVIRAIVYIMENGRKDDTIFISFGSSGHCHPDGFQRYHLPLAPR
jgi:hypothetical protein